MGIICFDLFFFCFFLVGGLRKKNNMTSSPKPRMFFPSRRFIYSMLNTLELKQCPIYRIPLVFLTQSCQCSGTLLLFVAPAREASLPAVFREMFIYLIKRQNPSFGMQKIKMAAP